MVKTDGYAVSDVPLRYRLPKDDTIAELETSSLVRLGDSFVLATRARWHGAVYLLGHYVEMALKSIFFRCLGFTPDEPIRPVDLRAASELARSDCDVAAPPERFHNPLFWAEATIRLRESLGFGTPVAVAREPIWRTRRIYGQWTVRMRYTRDLARLDDWTVIKNDTLWIKASTDALTATNGSTAS